MAVSRDTRVEWNGDETFFYLEQASDKAIFNGELFKDKERLFLKKNLRRHNVSFPIGQDRTVQIELRSFWQPEALQLNGRSLRNGTCVTLLADQRPPIRDAMAWIKLVWPLYKQGFSVVLMDFPGAGGSACRADVHAAYEDWQSEDYRIVEGALRGLQISRTHFVAFGRSCRTVLKFVKHGQIDAFSSFVAQEHCWYQPDIDFFSLFADELGECPPNRGQQWQLWAQEKQQQLFRELLKPVRIISFHDLYGDKQVQATHGFISHALSFAKRLAKFYYFEITRADISAARAHAEIPLSILVISKQLISTMIDFLAAAGEEDAAVPRYVSQQAIEDRVAHSSAPKRLTRPASAPASRTSLDAACERRNLQRDFKLNSQKELTIAISAQEATMRASYERVKQLVPPSTAKKQQQDFLLQLPSSLARWTREREEVFQEREAAIERKRLEVEEELNSMKFNRKTAEPEEAKRLSAWQWSSKRDSFVPEASERSQVSPETSPGLSQHRRSPRSPYFNIPSSSSHSSPRTASNRLPLEPELHDMPPLLVEEPLVERQEPQSLPKQLHDVPPLCGTPPRVDIEPHARPASAGTRRRPRSGKKRPASAGAVTNSLSRPSSASRLRDFFAKFSGSRPGSATAQPGPAAPVGAIGSWFHERRSFLKPNP